MKIATVAAGIVTLMVLTGCSAPSAGFETLEGESLEDVVLALEEDSEMDVRTRPDMALDASDSHQWFVVSWRANPTREAAEDIRTSDTLTLTLQSSLALASRECDTGEVGDEGWSLTIGTKGENDSFGDSYEGLLCVIEAINMPDSTLNRMASTRSLDGTVTDDWDGIRASWNYHPNSGMNLILELRD